MQRERHTVTPVHDLGLQLYGIPIHRLQGAHVRLDGDVGDVPAVGDGADGARRFDGNLDKHDGVKRLS